MEDKIGYVGEVSYKEAEHACIEELTLVTCEEEGIACGSQQQRKWYEKGIEERIVCHGEVIYKEGRHEHDFAYA